MDSAHAEKFSEDVFVKRSQSSIDGLIRAREINAKLMEVEGSY